MNKYRGIHFNFIKQPADFFIVHADTSFRDVFTDGCCVVVSVDCVGIAGSAVDFHINTEPAVSKWVFGISAFDAFFIIRPVFRFFMDFEQTFGRIGWFLSCGHGERLDCFALFVIGQLVAGFVDHNKLRIFSVFTVQLLAGSVGLMAGGEDKYKEQSKDECTI